MQSEWERIITVRFRDGPPNGWLEEWDMKRFESELRELFVGLTFTNHTSFDYAFCNLYEIEVEDPKTKILWVMTVRISFIVNAFSIHWTRYERDRRQGAVVTPSLTTCREIEQKVRQFLIEYQDFSEASVEDCDRPVLGIELELSGCEGVTIGKCIFQDYAG